MPPAPTYEQEERQRHALNVLENREQLIWHANHRNESVAQTALFFEKIFFGLDPAPARPLYSEAAYGEKLPDRLCIAATPKGKLKAPRSSAGGSSPTASASDTPSGRRSIPNRSSATHPRTPAFPHDDDDDDDGDEVIKVEQASPSQAHGRRTRSERSSGGSQNSSAKKKARKSLAAA